MEGKYKIAGEIAMVEFDLNAAILAVLDDDERRFREDAILDQALDQAKEVLVEIAEDAAGVA